ncbi:MAG: hypothetical protein IKN04_04885 [Clostridia bacterium]|nr:hypothetical protein [Clostridia bacterium]
MEPLTGGDAGMIRWGDRWLLILVRSNLKKIFERGFQKARFWTLDDDSLTLVLKKFSGGGVNLPDFSHVGVRGVWPNVQREFRPGKKFSSGVSKIADFRHVDMEGQMKGELPV